MWYDVHDREVRKPPRFRGALYTRSTFEGLRGRSLEKGQEMSGRLSHIKKERAARLIASGKTQAAAARDPNVDVTPVTMTNWAKDPEFQRRVETLRNQVSIKAEDILEQGVEEAAQTIVDIARGELMTKTAGENGETLVPADPKTITTRLKAALWILDRYEKGHLPEKGPEKHMPPPPTTDEEVDDLLSRGVPEDE